MLQTSRLTATGRYAFQKTSISKHIFFLKDKYGCGAVSCHMKMT